MFLPMGCENVASKKNQLECVQAGCDFAFVDCPFKYFPSRISFFFLFLFYRKAQQRYQRATIYHPFKSVQTFCFFC